MSSKKHDLFTFESRTEGVGGASKVNASYFVYEQGHIIEKNWQLRSDFFLLLLFLFIKFIASILLLNHILIWKFHVRLADLMYKR